MAPNLERPAPGPQDADPVAAGISESVEKLSWSQVFHAVYVSLRRDVGYDIDLCCM